MRERSLVMRLDHLMEMRDRWEKEAELINKERIAELTQKINALQAEIDRQNEEEATYVAPSVSCEKPTKIQKKHRL